MKQFTEYSVHEGEKIKGSRFIVTTVPISSFEDVRNIILDLQATHSNANHHCWAVRLRDGVERVNDDGEPNGSAGAPILQRMQRADLMDSLIVVTRYFGGTKLGVGGLMKAYGGAAGEAIDAVNLQQMVMMDQVEIQFTYSDQSTIRSVIHAHSGVLETEFYTDMVKWTVLFEMGLQSHFIEQCFDRTSGRVTPVFKAQKLIRMPS